MLEGGCYCGKVRYQLEGETAHVALVPLRGLPPARGGADRVLGGGEGRSVHGHRRGDDLRLIRTWPAAILPDLRDGGSSYTNAAVLPGLVDVQTGTLDDPEQLPPSAHIQAAERLKWMARVDDLPVFERYPG
jgi:hypothetical protein